MGVDFNTRYMNSNQRHTRLRGVRSGHVDARGCFGRDFDKG